MWGLKASLLMAKAKNEMEDDPNYDISKLANWGIRLTNIYHPHKKAVGEIYTIDIYNKRHAVPMDDEDINKFYDQVHSSYLSKWNSFFADGDYKQHCSRVQIEYKTGKIEKYTFLTPKGMLIYNMAKVKNLVLSPVKGMQKLLK